MYKTYSRGAWIAEIILFFSSFIIYFEINLKNFIKKVFYYLSIIIFILSLFLGYKYFSNKSEFLENYNNTKNSIITSEYFLKTKNIFVREGSTNKHIEGITKSFEIIKNSPEGQGHGRRTTIS